METPKFRFDNIGAWQQFPSSDAALQQGHTEEDGQLGDFSLRKESPSKKGDYRGNVKGNNIFAYRTTPR